MYNIHCEFWGGASGGYRSSLLKHHGTLISYETLEGATAVADELNVRMNDGPGVASFQYTPCPLGLKV